MNLSIHVIDKNPTYINGLLSCWGEIQINDFKETFIMSVEDWSINDYQSQWKDGLKKIEKDAASCLVTTVQNINTYPLVNLWALYRENDTIFIRNNLLFGKKFNKKVTAKPFTIINCYDYIPPKAITSEDGSKISEWVVKLID